LILQETLQTTKPVRLVVKARVYQEIMSIGSRVKNRDKWKNGKWNGLSKSDRTGYACAKFLGRKWSKMS
jgi:hypothetical protein